MPSDSRDRGSSSRKTSGGSRGHHRATDSGVGSLSDYDSLAANPDRDFSAASPQEYGSSSSSARYRLDIDRLRADNAQLEADKQAIHLRYKETKQELRDAQERAEKYKEDNEVLLGRIRKWEEHCARLQEDHDDLRRQLRGGSPRESTSNLAPHIRRRDSKRGSPPRNAPEDGMDQRLRDRLDGKSSDKAPSSTSGHSAQSGHSGRSRRDSFASHNGRPSVIVSVPNVPPNSSRSQTVYIPSSARASPAMSPTQYASTPRTSMSPSYPGYTEPAYFDPIAQGGDYVHEPLPKERQSKR